MRKNKEESKKQSSIEIDDTFVDVEMQEVQIESPHQKQPSVTVKPEQELVSCLRNERITVRHVPRASGMVTNPKHILYGGMAEGAKKTFVVPRLSSGTYVNVLTKAEKAYLEYIMGLDANALSVFNKVNNYWDDSNENGVSKVVLYKQDNYLNLADPEDFIRYKILLANKEYIAPSLKELEDRPKATYQFVIVSDGEEVKSSKKAMSTTMQCYKEYGKIEDDTYTLRTIIETIDGRPTAANSKLEFLQTKINDLIQADSKLFLKIVTDPLLPNKVLIKKCFEAGFISKRGDYYYLKQDNSPMCEHNEEPTFNIAAKYLASPKRQDLKFSLEAKLK